MTKTVPHSPHGALPATGYIRQSQLIGESTITQEQADANKRTGKGPRRPRAGALPIVPWSAATLWRKVRSGGFVSPVKLSEGVTAWKCEAVRAWLDAKAAA
jgi:prophage regulatory protein